MKKRSLSYLLATTIAGSILFTSCIGSFGLTSKLLSWNNSIDSKFVNELVFIAFWIVPVYEIAAIADVLVLNSIEFWSGDNPVADVGTVNKVETEHGIYAIETKADGYSILKEGEEKAVELVFNEAESTWNVTFDDESHKLLQFTSEDEVIMFLPDRRDESRTGPGWSYGVQTGSKRLFLLRFPLNNGSSKKHL